MKGNKEMIKYYIANNDKTKFAYLGYIPDWCIRTKGQPKNYVAFDSNPHIFSIERAKRIMSKLCQQNITGYQIFEITI